MKVFLRENFIFLIFLTIFLVSSLSAVNYFNSEKVFDAKVTYVNDVKLPLFVIVDFNKKVSENLNIVFEVIYKKENLVVGSSSIICKSNNCEIKLPIDKIFFGEYEILIRTKSHGRYYEKKINFKLENNKKDFEIIFNENYFYDKSSSMIINSKVKIDSDHSEKEEEEERDSKNNEKFYVEIFSEKFPENIETFSFLCKSNCEYDFELKKDIVFGKYIVKAYSKTFTYLGSFNISYNSNLTNITNPNLNISLNTTINSTLNTSFNETFNSSLNISLNTTLNNSLDLLPFIIPTNLSFLDRASPVSFKILNFPEEIFLGENFTFDILVSHSTIKTISSYLKLSPNLVIVSENITNNGTIFTINGTGIKPIQDLVIEHNFLEGTFIKKTTASNSQKIKDFQIRLPGTKVNEIVTKSNGKKDLKIINKKSNIEFKDLGNESDIGKIEVLNKANVKGLPRTSLASIETEILNVEASNFTNARVYLPKSGNQEIDKILTCKNLTSFGCSTSWVDSGLKFYQDANQVWFDATHFSAYMGVGAGYAFDVDFVDYGAEGVKINNLKNITVNVSCDNTGNCGTLNVTLYFLSSNGVKYVNSTVLDDFEAGLGTWANTATGDQQDWTRDQGGTPSSGTGPGGGPTSGFDHTIGAAGNYMYYETSNPVSTGDTAILLGPTFTGMGEIQLDSWWHILAPDAPTLALQFLNGTTWITLWSITGNFGDVWNNNISSVKYFGQTQFRYVGTKGASWASDIALDDMNISSYGKLIPNATTTPLWVMGSQIQQVTLNQNQNTQINFTLNTTGNIGDETVIFAIAQKSTDATVVSQSLDKTILTADPNPPVTTLVSPVDTINLTTVNVTFAANATDDYNLSSATLYVWDDTGSIFYTNSISITGFSQSFSIDYNFTQAGIFEWNYEVFDIGGNSAFASSNRTLNLSIPQVEIDYLNFADPYPILENNSRKFQANLTCVNGDCGQVNVTLYAYSESPPIIIENETLETGFGSWTVDGGSCTWVRNQDFTPSNNVGPGGTNNAGSGYDHTLGTPSGWYAYVEASGSVCQGGDPQAVLTGPSFNAGTKNTTLQFWYHMFGNGAGAMGDLHVDVWNGTMWVNDVYILIGEQQTVGTNPFWNATVDLSSYSGLINVRIRYDNVGGWQADAAIDDILIIVENGSSYDAFPTTTVIPFWTNSTNPLTISNMNQGDSQLVTFYINATGSIGNKTQVYLESAINPIIGFTYFGNEFNFSIDGPQAPTGVKTNPTSGSSSSEQGMSFNGTATSKYGLESVILYVWNSSGAIVNNTNISYYSDNNIAQNTSNYFNEFTYANAYKWNLYFTDIYNYSGFASDGNWTLNIINEPPWNTSELEFSGNNGDNYNRTDTIYTWASFADKLGLSYSYLEHNGTGSFENYSSEMSGRTFLTNYTLNLWNSTMFSKVGLITLRAMHGIDNGGLHNTTDSLQYNFTLYGFADIVELLPEPAAVGEWNQSSLVYCGIADNFTGIVIPNYNVDFYNNISGYLGTNVTDAFGKAYITVNITQPMNFSCNISNDLSLFYYANVNYSSVEITRNQITPWWNSWDVKYVGGGSVSDGALVNRSENIFAHSYWFDNYQLYHTEIEHTNASGSLENFSIIPFPTILNANESWANYSFDFSNGTEFGVGLVNISALYGSDKAENQNVTTPSHYFYLYGFANISSFEINDTIYPNSTTINILCTVTDNMTLMGIPNYPVNITSNQTGVIFNGLTDSNGLVSFDYLDVIPGYENISCILGDKSYYNKDVLSTSLIVYNDIDKPYIVSNFSTTISKVHPGESTILQANWSESILSADILTDNGYFSVTDFTGNWTKGTITTDLSWAKGPHNVGFVEVVDEQFNVNSSSGNITLDIYHYANITALTLSESEIFVGSTAIAGCLVEDVDINSEISGYNVSFYSNGVYFNSSLTDATGWANVDYTPATSGFKTILCNITTDATNYYDPVIGGAFSSEILSVVSLNGRACSGDLMSVLYNNYFDSVLNDGFELREGANCAGTNNNFASWLAKITPRADSYGGYNNGPVDGTTLHSNQALDALTDMRMECRSGGRTPREIFTHLYENVNPASLIGFKILYYYANRAGRELTLTGSPNVISTLIYNTNRDSVNASNYLNYTLSPLVSACTGESLNDGPGQTAYYQEIDTYPSIQKMIDEGLSTIDLRFAFYAQANYNFDNTRATFNFNEFELYAKVLTVSMTAPVTTIETYPNKTQSLTCSVPTSGRNTSNVDLYPQFCSGLGCSSFTNIDNVTGALRVNETTFACADQSCLKTFYISYSEEGNYSLRCNATNFDSYSAVSTSKDMKVYVANMSVFNVSHDMDELDEYEVGDTISHINVSAYNNNRGKAYFANITTTILNSSGIKPSWLTSLPQTTMCTNPMDMDSYCADSYDNSGSGHLISNDSIAGDYNISVNLQWINILGNVTNTTTKFKILDLRNNFSSAFENATIKNSQIGNVTFNLTNLWTTFNITNINVSINCEINFTCNNSNLNYVYLSSLENNSVASFLFNVSPSKNVETGFYNFTFNVSYTNPRGFTKTWEQQTIATMYVPPLPHYIVSKSITAISSNQYLVNLTINNLVNLTQNILVLDFVDDNFTAGSFTPFYDFINTSPGDLVGTFYVWNLTLVNISTVNLNYSITGNIDNLEKNYIFGVE